VPVPETVVPATVVVSPPKLPQLRGSTADGTPAGLGTDTVLLIIASNRPKYLERCLTKVVEHHPLHSVPIVVSEDQIGGPHAEVGKRRAVAAAVSRARAALVARGGTVVRRAVFSAYGLHRH
jgi:hypothetical protein